MRTEGEHPKAQELGQAMDENVVLEAEAADPLVEAQLALEQEMVDGGLARYRARAAQAKRNQEVTRVAHGVRAVRATVGMVIEKVESWLSDCRAAGRGRRARVLPIIEEVGADVATYLAVRIIVNRTLGNRKQDGVTLASVAVQIGSAVSDELRALRYKAADKDGFKRTMRYLDREHQHGTANRKRALGAIATKQVGAAAAGLTLADRVAVGVRLVELVCEATGMFFTTTVVKGRGRNVILSAQPEALEWVDQLEAQAEISFPELYPMVVPPRDWTSPFDGGYLTRFPAHPLLIGRASKAFLRSLVTDADLSEVYEAVNIVQRTPRRVNLRVLEVAELLYERGVAVGKSLASREPLPHTIKSPLLLEGERRMAEWKEAGDKGAMRAWREEHREEITRYRRTETRRWQAERRRLGRARGGSMTLRMARKFADYSAIYFPHNFDSRGRMYALPWGLNPQGSDLAKALLLFAEGKPLTQENGGFFWLAVHVANTYGYDKVSFEDRVAWTEQRTEEITAIAADPIGSFPLWSQADAPFQYLAACLEWAEAWAYGEGYVSHLPVGMDGSCNGLQHYSAMTRDEVGGALVNLTPSERPADVYARVAAEVESVLSGLLTDTVALDHEMPEACQFRTPREWANLWLRFGLDRKITKRSVMTLPYSATMYACRAFVQEAIEEKIEKGAPNVFAHVDEEGKEQDGYFAASAFLYRLVWDAIGRVVVGAREAMAFIKDVAKLALKAGDPFQWTTPDGFVVEQVYRNNKVCKIDTRLNGGVRYQLSIGTPTLELDKLAMLNGVAPNFVHSYDACALRMYVRLAYANGIAAHSLVHDSYGTLAADVNLMQVCIRQAFVDLYTEFDALALFREDMSALVDEMDWSRIPQLPKRGSLDLQGVLSSDFFFS